LIIKQKTAALILGAVMVAAPGLASAQDAAPFVGGLGGVTFGTVSSGAVAARAGLPIGSNLSVIFEVGRMQNVMPSAFADDIELLEDLISLEAGVPVTLDVSIPATHGFVGLRYQGRGAAVMPFVEGGFGFARLSASVNEITIMGIDFGELVEDELGEDVNATKALLALGGGVRVPVSGAVSLDAGYRYTRIFTEDPAINSSMVYAAINFSFQR
jgi:hypothetical protein